MRSTFIYTVVGFIGVTLADAGVMLLNFAGTVAAAYVIERFIRPRFRRKEKQ